MPDLNVEQEIQRLATVVEEEVTAARQAASAQPVVDPGAEAMERAGELSAKALRESFAEAAKRVLQVGDQAVADAMEKQRQCKEDADRLMAYGEAKSNEFLDLFRRNRDASVGLTEIRNLLALPSVPQKLNS